MTALLHTENLCAGYVKEGKEHFLFDKLNLSIPAGQLICFMGPNGIGKSTLIRTLAGLQKPLAGRVLHDEGSVTTSQRVAVVLTDRVSSVNLTVRELITYGRYPYLNWTLKLTAEDQAIIEQAINQLHLGNLVNKKIYELSDGQLQMAMIARALAQHTRLIILDEPTSHLDLNNRVEIMNLLRCIAHDMNKGILIATHELDLALQTADLVWLTGKEKNILTGVPEDLVLNNAFDDIFQFKGFDLKTGKVEHQLYRKTKVKLTGEGHTLLWTRNALERNGYAVTPDSNTTVSIVNENGLEWVLTTSGHQTVYYNIEHLLLELHSMEAKNVF